MPISSFHGLRKNSVPAKAWNSTKTPQRSPPSRSSATSNNARKIPYGLPRLWDNEYHEAFVIDREDDREHDDAKYSKSYPSSGVACTQKSNGRICRKLSANSRPKSARLPDRGLKRRDTFPRFAAENAGSPRTEGHDYKRSKSDPSIGAEKKQRKGSIKSLKRPSTLWTVGKREDKPSSALRKRKVCSPLFHAILIKACRFKIKLLL